MIEAHEDRGLDAFMAERIHTMLELRNYPEELQLGGAKTMTEMVERFHRGLDELARQGRQQGKAMVLRRLIARTASWRGIPLVLLAGIAAACGPETIPSGDLTITTDTVGGVVRVANTGTAPAWQLTPVVSIGPTSLAETGAPQEFGRVNSAALGPDGTVFVADGLNDEVRVFGLDGVHRRTFGRNGEGPGEFRSLYSLAWVGDRLLTLDPNLGRIGAFSAEGEWLGQQRIEGSVSGSPERHPPNARWPGRVLSARPSKARNRNRVHVRGP